MSQLPCANTKPVGDEKAVCQKLAHQVCNNCFMVQYCSRECQLAHWAIHKTDCKSSMTKNSWKPGWHLENRSPAFISEDPEPFIQYGEKKYLWGNVPALDLMSFENNEGENLPESLHLLFAASGDIRNVVKSVAGIPSSYSGKVEVVVNDKDFDIVARNAILLLAALHFEPAEAAQMMLHIWYSALIPGSMLNSLQEKVLPCVEDVCSKIREKPEASLQAKTWTVGSRSLRMVLPKVVWDRLPSYFKVPSGLSGVEARNVMVATTLAPERRDYFDRAMYTKPPHWRLGIKRFREDGILLPFGSSRVEFDTPNPTMFQSRDFWSIMDSADPLEGWPVSEIIQKAPFAKNDIFGSLSNYLSDILLDFCHSIEKMNLRFHLFQVDALKLPTMIKGSGIKNSLFDRIEVSNICDRGYVGPQKTLSTFGPLLSPNPHATLLFLFLNAVHESMQPSDHLAFILSETARVKQYLPFNQSMLRNRNGWDPDFQNFNDARMMFRDFDMLFARFMGECRLEELGREVGLVMKKENTLVNGAWPLRMREGASKEEFDLLMGSGHIGSERYVEWKRAD